MPLDVDISTTRGLVVVSPYGGLNLSEMCAYVRAHGRLPADPPTMQVDVRRLVCGWLVQLCLSLAHVHQKGMVSLREVLRCNACRPAAP